MTITFISLVFLLFIIHLRLFCSLNARWNKKVKVSDSEKLKCIALYSMLNLLCFAAILSVYIVFFVVDSLKVHWLVWIGCSPVLFLIANCLLVRIPRDAKAVSTILFRKFKESKQRRCEISANKTIVSKLVFLDESGVFLSYRTSDVLFVRFIAEQLMARSISVWFDEYRISLNQKGQIARDENEFHSIITNGVEKSKSAICFTNPDYTSSHYCKSEAEKILKELPRSKILNVACPDHLLLYQQIPQMSGGPIIQLSEIPRHFKIPEVQKLWGEILMHLKMNASPLQLIDPLPEIKTFTWQKGLQYSLDLAGWINIDEDSDLNERAHSDEQMEFDKVEGYFGVKINNMPIVLYLTTGLFTAKPRDFFNSQKDRPFYFVQIGEMFRDFLNNPKFGYGRKMVAIHLVNFSGKRSCAFTQYDDIENAWWRHYVLIFENPVYEQMKDEIPDSYKKERPDFEFGREIEISLQFTMQCSFEEFCSVAYLMDRVASSVKLV